MYRAWLRKDARSEDEEAVTKATPILIQVYFNPSLTWGLMKLFRVDYRVARPGARISAPASSSLPWPPQGLLPVWQLCYVTRHGSAGTAPQAKPEGKGRMGVVSEGCLRDRSVAGL